MDSCALERYNGIILDSLKETEGVYIKNVNPFSFLFSKKYRIISFSFLGLIVLCLLLFLLKKIMYKTKK
jgi:hypothetical protein